MVHADVHDRKGAVSVRKSSGTFNQLQHPVQTKVGKQRDGEFRGTLSAETRPFVTYFNKEKRRNSQLDSRFRNTVTMDLPDDY